MATKKDTVEPTDLNKQAEDEAERVREMERRPPSGGPTPEDIEKMHENDGDDADGGLVTASAGKPYAVKAGRKLRVYVPDGHPGGSITADVDGMGKGVRLNYGRGVTIEELPVRRITDMAPGMQVHAFKG